MRMDKFLKVSRLIKRRTVANEACDAGRVSVGGKPVRASYEVKVGDEIEIAFGSRTVRVSQNAEQIVQQTKRRAQRGRDPEGRDLSGQIDLNFVHLNRRLNIPPPLDRSSV